MEWIEVANPSGKRVPKWIRSAALSEDDVVFVPGAISGNEMNAVLCASYDGTPLVQYLKHAYFPAQWLAKEYPKVKEVCEKIESTVRKVCAQRREDE